MRWDASGWAPPTGRQAIVRISIDAIEYFDVMKRVSGLTLIEALVVIAIVVVLAAVGVPSFQSMMARRSADHAAALFIADVQFARSEALKRGHSVTICPSFDGTGCAPGKPGWARGWVVFPSPAGVGTVGSAGVLRVQGPLRGIVSFKSHSGSSGADNAIRFNARGLAPGDNGTIFVTAHESVQGGKRLLCIASTGRISLRPVGEVECA